MDRKTPILEAFERLSIDEKRKFLVEAGERYLSAVEDDAIDNEAAIIAKIRERREQVDAGRSRLVSRDALMTRLFARYPNP